MLTVDENADRLILTLGSHEVEIKAPYKITDVAMAMRLLAANITGSRSEQLGLEQHTSLRVRLREADEA